MKARILLLFAILAAAGLISCTADGGNIYSTIETEVKTVDNYLPTTLTGYDITKAPDNNYYVAAGGIYQGTLASGTINWNPNNNVAGYPYNPTNGALCNALVTFNGATWGGFYLPDGTIPGLEKSDGSYSFASSTSAGDTNGNITGKQIYLLSAPNGNNVLFAVCIESNGSFGLYYSTNGTAWSPSAGLQGVTGVPISGVAWDGTKYWAVSGITVYSSPAGDPSSFSAAAVQPTGITSSDSIRGITVGQNGWLFLPTKLLGIFYSSNGGGSWTAITTPQINSVTVGFLTVSNAVDGGNAIYLAGSDGDGYYTFNTSTLTLSRMSMTTIALYSESVRRILVDSVNHFVLVGTNSEGVWSATFDPGTGDVLSGTAWTGPSS